MEKSWNCVLNFCGNPHIVYIMLIIFSYHFRMVICGLTSPKLDFADAAGMLDIGGFDPTVPTLIHRFIQGEL